MFGKSRVALATLSAVGLTIGIAGMASADSASGYFSTQTTSSLHCQSGVAGGNPGGKISARVAGQEVRKEAAYFRTATVVTTYNVYKAINGDWFYFSSGTPQDAYLGAARHDGTRYVAPWVYPSKGTSHNPRFGVNVPTSGLYEVRISSDLYNQDGIWFGNLTTTEGTCQFTG